MKENFLQRFEQSMKVDYEKWHDGIGYDLEAIAEASPSERIAIENILVTRGARDWRDVEALAAIRTPGAINILNSALTNGNEEIRTSVLRYAPELASDNERIAVLVDALKKAEFYGGLSQALSQVERSHPPEVIDALLHGVLDRSGEIAVHFAAMLMFIYGKTNEPFDMEMRPFFLRFNTPDRKEREIVFRELCERLDIQPPPG